jgi:exodeoxyribonuclease V gamma subunit
VTLDLRIAARPEELLDALDGWLSVLPEDPFGFDVIVVPNAGIREWVTSELLARHGVLSHVEFLFPAELTRRALGLPRPEEDVWRPERLTWQVLALMAEGVDLGATPWRGLPDRPWTVARRVADLLERYATQRPDLVDAWLRGEDTDGSGALGPARHWQAATWRAVRGRVDAPSSAELLLTRLQSDGQEDLSDDRSVLPSRVAMFGVSSLSAPAAAVVAHVARTCDVLMLATTPSPRLLEAQLQAQLHAQVGTVTAALHVAPVRSVDHDPDVHPLLLAWGRPAIETAAVLARLPGAVVLGAADDAGGAVTQLTRLQHVLHAGDATATPTLDRASGGDGSVQVHACHGLVRQLEVVRDAILHAMVEDPTLRPRDIAVLCADLEAVAPLAGPILGADVGGRSLPVLVTDRAAATSPPVQAALDAALALATSRLERDQVLTFLALPVVAAALGLDDDDLALLESSADVLDVRWGRDAVHRTRWGYPASMAVGTWRETIDRLLAGLLLEADGPPVAGIAPATGVATQDIARLGRLADALAVVGHLAGLADGARSMADWEPALRWLVDTLLRPDRALDVETHGYVAQAGRIHDLVTALVADATTAGGDVLLDIREVRAALADRLTSGGSRARLRTGHVSVASLTPLRGVPFRLIAVVGVADTLGGGAGADDDDVLALAPRVGERDATDEHRAAMLDAVLAVRGTLIVTCDGQDVRTGKVLALPTTVEELLDALPAAPGASDTPGAPDAPVAPGAPLVIRHPRHLADRRNLSVGDDAVARVDRDRPWTFSPAALRAVAAAEALEVAERDIDGPRSEPGVGVLTESTSDGRWRTVELPTPAQRDGQRDVVQLQLDDVIGALTDPIGVLLRDRLGMRLPRERTSAPRPVELWVEDGLERWRFGDDLLRHLGAGGTAQDWVAQRPAWGGLPPGALGRELLAGFIDEVSELHALAQVGPRGATAASERAAIGLELTTPRGRRVRLSGSVEHRDGTIVDVAYSRDHPSHVLRTAVRLLAMAVGAERLVEARVVRRAADTRSAAGVHELRLREGDAALARAALGALVDLVLRIRTGPAPLLPRAAWRIEPSTDLLRAPEPDLATDVERDLGDAATRAVLGVGSLRDLAMQDDGPLEEGLPDAPTPVQRWSRALREPLVDALESAHLQGPAPVPAPVTVDA